MKILRLIILALPTLLFSCSGSVDDLLGTGQFSSTITGAVSKSLDGAAGFIHNISTKSGAEISILEIEMINPNNSDEMITLNISDLGNKSGIKTGTYKYEAPGTGGNIVMSFRYEDGTVGFIYPDDTKINNLVITSVSDTVIKGSFEITLLDVLQTESVSIKGTFTAVGATTTI